MEREQHLQTDKKCLWSQLTTGESWRIERRTIFKIGNQIYEKQILHKKSHHSVYRNRRLIMISDNLRYLQAPTVSTKFVLNKEAHSNSYRL